MGWRKVTGRELEIYKTGEYGLQEDRSVAVVAGLGIASVRALVAAVAAVAAAVVAVGVDAALPGSGLVGGHSFAGPGCLHYRHCLGSSNCR